MIPTYDEMMLPFLEILSDKKEHSLQEVVDILQEHFDTTEEEKRQLTPSGQQPVFRNRVGWARTYLKKAGLLDSNRRAVYTITERGLKVLAEGPQKIDNEFLSRFPEFLEFQGRQSATDETKEEIIHTKDQTPDEELEFAFQRLKSNLAKELIDTVKSSSPAFFEKLVVDLLLRMGYGGSRKDAGEAIGKSNDGGIDGIIKEDRLGLDIIYIQAKRWESTVPVREIRDFAGALLSKKAKKGVFITTSSFPQSAHEFVAGIEHKIILVDGNQLTDFMIEHGVGVTTENVYEVKKLDSDYFE